MKVIQVIRLYFLNSQVREPLERGSNSKCNMTISLHMVCTYTDYIPVPRGKKSSWYWQYWIIYKIHHHCKNNRFQQIKPLNIKCHVDFSYPYFEYLNLWKYNTNCCSSEEKALSWYVFLQTPPKSRTNHKLQLPKGEASPTIGAKQVKMSLETRVSGHFEGFDVLRNFKLERTRGERK